MKKSFFLAILMLIILGVSCPAQSNNPFVGTWSGINNDGQRVIFVSEGLSWGIFYEHSARFWDTGFYTINGNTAILISLEEPFGSATVSRNNLTIVMDEDSGFPEGYSITFTKQSINDDARKQFEGTWTGYVDGDYAELSIAGSTWRRRVHVFNDSGTYLVYGNYLVIIDSDGYQPWLTGTVAGNGIRFETYIGLRPIQFTLFRR